jgi:hypothetical protein
MKKAIAKKSTDKKAAVKNIAASYNRYKTYDGKQYTGMTIGRGHKWNYDKGIWIDKKMTPEKMDNQLRRYKTPCGQSSRGFGYSCWN